MMLDGQTCHQWCLLFVCLYTSKILNEMTAFLLLESIWRENVKLYWINKRNTHILLTHGHCMRGLKKTSYSTGLRCFLTCVYDLTDEKGAVVFFVSAGELLLFSSHHHQEITGWSYFLNHIKIFCVCFLIVN